MEVEWAERDASLARANSQRRIPTRACQCGGEQASASEKLRAPSSGAAARRLGGQRSSIEQHECGRTTECARGRSKHEDKPRAHERVGGHHDRSLRPSYR